MFGGTGGASGYLVESAAGEVSDQAAKKGRKLTWDEVKALFKRGNDYNKKARNNYQFNEIHLENGKRLDSYVPPTNGKPGEIISRKATTLSDIKVETFEGYLKELTTKYAKNTQMKSSKIAGKLEGDYFLEIPTSNKSFFENSVQHKNLAQQYSVTIKYLDE